MTADDFEAQLDADPRDWTCRLAYSDWLEEQDRQAEAECQRWLVKHERCCKTMFHCDTVFLWSNKNQWGAEYDDGEEISGSVFCWLFAEIVTGTSMTERYASRRAAEADLCQALQLAKPTRRKR